MRIHILLDLTPVSNFYAGIGQVAISLVKSFRRQNVDVTLLVRKEKVEELQDQTVGYSFRLIPLYFPRPFIFFHLFFLGFYINNLRGVYFCINHRLPLFIKSKFKVIFVHDFVYKRFPETMRLGGRIFDYALGEFLVRRAELVCFNSPQTREEWRRYIGACENDGVYYFLYLLGLVNEKIVFDVKEYDPHRPIFLCVGSLEPRKNVPLVLEVFSRFRKEVPGARLFVVGGDAWGKQYPLSGNGVEFFWRCDDQDLANLYSRADVLIMMSSYEGFSLPLLEAANAGLVILSTRTGIAPDIVLPENLLDVPDEVHLLELMLRVNASEQLRERAIEFSYKRKGRYSFDRSTRGLVDLISSVKQASF